MKISITIKGRDWHGDDIDMTYSPRMTTIIERVRHENEDNLIEMNPLQAIIATAMKKWYGVNAFFWRDRGLADAGIYGQVCEACDDNSNNCITPRVRLDITVDGHDVCKNSELYEIAPELYKGLEG